MRSVKYTIDKVKFFDNYIEYKDVRYEISYIQDILISKGKKEVERLTGISIYKLNNIIDRYKLKCKNINNVIKGRDVFFDEKKVNVDEFIDFYITKNNSKKDCIKHFEVTNSQLSWIICKFNIVKPNELSYEINKKTLLERYGDEHYNNMEKNKQTCIERYGVDNIFKDVDFMKKCYYNKLGVSNPNKLRQVREKMENTCLEKYGSKFPSSTKEFRDKCIKTSLIKYGVKHPMQSDEVKNKFDFKRICEKAFETKLKNKTTNTSKPEKYLVEELINIFGKEDVKTQYKDNERYPFHCDAYVKSLDLFIEVNLYFTHGKHLFNCNDEQDIEKLNLWKSKNTKFYSNAINVWTKLDPLKFEYAKKYNLNYIAIYNLKDIEELLNKLKGEIKNVG